MAVSPASQVAPPRRTLTREVVPVGSGRQVNPRLRALPHPLDALTRDLGLTIYGQMLIDAQVSACVTLMKAAILEDGMTLAPAITDSKSPDYRLAVDIRDEGEAMLNNLETPLDEVLWTLADAMAYGSKVADKVYDTQPGLKHPSLFQLIRLKPKPVSATHYVVDAFMNVVGLAPSASLSDFSPAEVIPRDKFVHLAWHPVDCDPRGTSLLRPAYEAWWRKQQLIPEYLRYLAQFAGPSIWATTPEDATLPPSVDPLGNVDAVPDTSTPEQVLLESLLLFQGSTAAAFPFGTSLNLIQSDGDGAAFVSAFSLCNQEITKGILTQELATEQSVNQARAAAQVHQDVFETLVRQGKKAFVRMVQRQVLLPWVEFNWGPAARNLVPVPSLGTTEEQDLPALIRAYAAAWSSGLLAPSHLPAIDARFGLPARDLTQEPASPQAGIDGRPVQDGKPPGGKTDQPPEPSTSKPAPGRAPQPGQGGG